MGTFETLAKTGASKAPIIESYSINKSFACDTVVAEGAIVKLKSDGAVTPVTAETDYPLGLVVVGNKVVDGKVTVQTNFSAIILGKANAITVIGNDLAAKSYDATAKLTVFDVAASADHIAATALTAGAATATIVVGLRRVPTLKA